MFQTKLEKSWSLNQSLLCVGLDTDPNRIPQCIKGDQRLFEFNRAIIEATAASVCAFKPQIAYYAAIGAEKQLEQTINYIKSNHPDLLVILDAKRGDIGATAKMYAKEAFERYNADAVTVNPYMGGDTLEPFLEYQDRGVIVLCRTSNPGSGDLQQLEVGPTTSLSTAVARKAFTEWNTNNNVGLVVGATYPEEIRQVRELVGNMPLLVPGIGAQGGDLEAVVKAGIDANKNGLMINASRSIIYAGDGENFAEAAASEAALLHGQINVARS